jgi:hypothetical protein
VNPRRGELGAELVQEERPLAGGSLLVDTHRHGDRPGRPVLLGRDVELPQVAVECGLGGAELGPVRAEDRGDLVARLRAVDPDLGEAAVVAREVGRLAQAHAGARRGRELDEVEAGGDRGAGLLAGRGRARDEDGGDEGDDGERSGHGGWNAARHTDLRSEPC